MKALKKKSKEKIALHLMSSLKYSGMERMFQSSAGKWEANGWEVIIVGQGNDHPFADKLSAAGYRVRFIRKIRSFGGLFDFARMLVNLNPAVVHIHAESMHGPVSLLVRILRPRLQIIHTIHSTFNFTGFIRFKRLCQHAMLKLARVKSVSVSSEVAINESVNFHLKSQIIENWISDSFFDSRSKNIEYSTEPFVIGLVGNCSSIKNHSELLEAISKLSGFKVLHIGSESEAPVSELQFLDLLEQEKKLIRYGEQPHVQDLLRECHLFAMPSTHEGFGMALAEALALGIPCFISEARGLFWAHNLPGVKVVKNSTGWVSALQELNLDFLLQERAKALNSRALYQERWSADRGVSEYVRVYSS